MKKTPLRYIFLLVFSFVICIAGASIVTRVLVNKVFVKRYNAGNYNTKLEEKLLLLNFPESYTPFYNLGDAYYKQESYSEAAGYFTEALKMYPPEDKECSIRINLALALCNTIDFDDLSSQDKIDTAIYVLYKARDVLLENGWAVEEGDNFRDADAQQLKEDIDKMLEKLENPDKSNDDRQKDDKSSEQEKDDSSDGENKSSPKEKRQQDELQKSKEGAMKERQETRQSSEGEKRAREKEEGQVGGSDGQGGEGTPQPVKQW